MRILFVCSGNNYFGISPIVKTQGESLIKKGIKIDYYPIIGKGWSGYIKNIYKLHRYIKNSNYNLIHAHYALSAVCAALASRHIPVIVSLMGSDLMLSKFWNMLIRYFSNYIWCCTVVKSQAMKRMITARRIQVIPNGVDINVYRPLDRESCRLKLNFTHIKNILFVGDPDRPEKNYSLAGEAVEKLNDPDINLQIVKGVDQAEMVYYYNAADLLLLTSLWEGSPNVIKEAMACNLPIISTDVGDVREIASDISGCYIADCNPVALAEKIKQALDFSGRTKGRDRLMQLGLDSDSIANKLIMVYYDLLK